MISLSSPLCFLCGPCVFVVNLFWENSFMRNVWCFGILLAAAATASAQDMPLTQVLLPGEGWQAALKDNASARSLAGDGRGNVYVADPDGKQIWKIDKDGKASVFAKTATAAHGLAVAAEGRLFAAESDAKEIMVYGADGKQAAEYKDMAAAQLAVTKTGEVYCAVPDEKAVYLIDLDGKKRKVASDFVSPGALTLSSDGGTLVVGDAGDRYLYAFRVQKSGDLDARDRYYPLWVRPKQPSDNAGLTLDSAGRAYATSREGVQVFDPTGRLSGILVAPERAALDGVAFGGADLDRLYVACGGKVYVRKLLAKGVKAAEAKGK
jgi:gluconolactonase